MRTFPSSSKPHHLRVENFKQQTSIDSSGRPKPNGLRALCLHFCWSRLFKSFNTIKFRTVAGFFPCSNLIDDSFELLKTDFVLKSVIIDRIVEVVLIHFVYVGWLTEEMINNCLVLDKSISFYGPKISWRLIVTECGNLYSNGCVSSYTANSVSAHRSSIALLE